MASRGEVGGVAEGDERRKRAEPVVNYHDAVLYSEDVGLLDPGQWLNDAVLSFALEYFRHDHPQVHAERGVVFVDPGSVQLLLALGPEEGRALVLDPIGATGDATRLIVIPFNSAGVAQEFNAGEHWALLVHDVGQRKAHYFDSMPSDGMAEMAHALAARISTALHGARSRTHEVVTWHDFPTQTNSFDCGMYVLVAAEHAAMHGVGSTTSFHHLTPKFVSEQRRRWQAIVDEVRSK